MRHAKRHIKPPPVDAVRWIPVAVRIHPAPRRRENVVPRTRHNPLLILAELRQRLVPEPPFVVEARSLLFVPPRLHYEPIGIRRLLLVLHHVKKRPTARAHVIEDAVENYPDPPRMTLLDQLQRQLVRRRPDPSRRIARILPGHQLPVTLRIRPEIRIDVMEAHPVIFMRRWGVEDRIKINRVDPQILQVAEFVEDPLQIPAITPALDQIMKGQPRALLPLLALIPIRRPWMNLPRQIRRIGKRSLDVVLGRIIGRIPVAETLRKNLIPHRVLGPRRNKFRLGWCVGLRRQRTGHADGRTRHNGHSLHPRASISRPASTKASVLIPNSFITVPPGALIPNRSIPIARPRRPT